MGKHAPSPPPAPDPVQVANAQSASNIATAEAQQKLNMVGSTNPYGTVNYSADPTQPGGYRQTTTLSPEQQAIYDAQAKTELGAVNIANDQLGRVQNALQTPLDTTGLPQLSGGVDLSGLNPGSGIQTNFNGGQPLQYSFNPGQQVQGQVGGDLNAARYQNMLASYNEQAAMLDPRFQRDQTSLEQRLADQGFSQNSEGYQQALQSFNRDKNAAYQQAVNNAVGQGETAANNLFQRQLGQGQFANSAAAQEYAQNQGQAAFHNQTAGQDYSQNLGAAQFNNQAQQQAFAQQLAAIQAQQQNAQFGNQARQQGLQERAYVQNQPINQLTGLLSLGQVQTPQGIQYTPSNVAPTDVLGAYALNQQAQNAAYQAKLQSNSGLMGGLFSLGSAAIMASDGRLKTDKRLLRVRSDGVEVWAFRYLSDPEGVVRIGVMAQQLRKIRPDLVVKRPDGFLAVNYALLPEAA